MPLSVSVAKPAGSRPHAPHGLPVKGYYNVSVRTSLSRGKAACSSAPANEQHWIGKVRVEVRRQGQRQHCSSSALPHNHQRCRCERLAKWIYRASTPMVPGDSRTCGPLFWSVPFRAQQRSPSLLPVRARRY